MARDRAISDGNPSHSSACQRVAGPAPAQLPIYGPEKRHRRLQLVGILNPSLPPFCRSWNDIGPEGGAALAAALPSLAALATLNL